MLIALCGIDGAGKTTQGNLLSDYYIKNGYDIHFLKQHTQDYYRNEGLSKYLYSREDHKKESSKDLALFSAYDRMKNYHCNIEPLLSQGGIILLDRYIYSAYAYSMVRGNALPWLLEINKLIPRPNLTFYIDITASEAKARLGIRSRLTVEEKSKHFLKAVRQIFLDQPWGRSDSYYIINGMRSPMEVNTTIAAIINLHLREKHDDKSVKRACTPQT